MAEKEYKAVAKLFLETKDANKDADAFCKDLKRKLGEIESAADKMTAFKDLASYIEAADKRLAEFKANNQDAFNNMFDGMDASLKVVFENIFKISKDKLVELNNISDQLKNKTADTIDPAALKEWEKSVKGIYALLNEKSGISGHGKIETRFQRLQEAVTNFATVWKGVTDTLSNGFGAGGIASGIQRSPQDIQTELDRLDQQNVRLGKIQQEFQKIKADFDKLNDGENVFFSSDTKFDLSDIKTLVSAFKQAKKTFDNFEGDKNSIEYYEIVLKYMQQAAKLKGMYEALTLNPNEANKEIMKQLKKMPGKKEKETQADILGDIVDKADSALSDGLLESLTKFDKGPLSDLFAQIDSQMTTLEDEIEKLNQATGNVGVGFDKMGQHAVSATEYIRGMTIAIKEMFDALSQASDAEYKVLISGQDISIKRGQNKETSSKTTAEAYLANIMQDTDLDAHTHQGLIADINTPDFKQAIQRQYAGLAKMSAIIGDKDIVTLDLAKVKAEDAYTALNKLKELTNTKGKQSLDVNEFNKIFTDINPDYANVAKRWNPSKFSDLATYIFNVKQSAQQAFDPVQRLQNLLIAISGKQIDFSKYEDLFKTLSANNVGDVFNQIAKAENIKEDGQILQVQDITSGSVQDVVADIQKQKDAFLELRQTAGVTYEEIAQAAKEYSNVYNKAEGQNFEFFKKYFHASEIDEIQKKFMDLGDGFRDLDGLTKELAMEFGIDPDEIESFSQAGSVAQGASQQLKTFYDLVDKIRNKSFDLAGDATDNLEIGEYIERLNSAKAVLDELGDQGQLTAEQIDQVNNAFNAANEYLTNSAVHYSGYGYGEYDYSYYEEYEDAMRENDELRQRNSELEDQLKNRRNTSQQNTFATVSNEAQVVNSAQAEAAQLDTLLEKINAVKDAVGAKTQAFETERTTVDTVVAAEIESLKQLEEYLTTLQNLISNIFTGESFKVEGIDNINNSGNPNGNTSMISILQTVSETLDSIYGVLQGFTGIEADNKNSIKQKEPVVDNNINQNELSENDSAILSSILNAVNEISNYLATYKSNDVLDGVDQQNDSGYALEATLQNVKGVLDDILSGVNKDDSLSALVESLSAAVASLKDVANGIIQHQKAQKSDTRVAQARIADPIQQDLIRQKAQDTVQSLGTEVKIASLKALADGLVRVSGAVKKASGEWEGFTVKVNEADEAVGLVVDDQSEYAKSLNKASKQVNDNSIFKSEAGKQVGKFDLDRAKLQKDVNIPDSFKQQIQDARTAIANAADEDALKIAINNWEALKNQIHAAVVEQDLYIEKSKNTNTVPDQFTKDLRSQKTSFGKYKRDTEDAIDVTDELKQRLKDLETELANINDSSGLRAWQKKFNGLKSEITATQSSYKRDKNRYSQQIMGQANAGLKSAGIKKDGTNLTEEQQKIIDKYNELEKQIDEYNKKVNAKQQAETSGIEQTKAALLDLIATYKQANNIVDAKGNPSRQAYGTAQVQNFNAKYNSLQTRAKNVGLTDDFVAVQNLANAYEKLKEAQAKFKVGEDLTTDAGKAKVEAFKQAQIECNRYAKELNRVVTESEKLQSNSVDASPVSENFQDTMQGRKRALEEFINVIPNTAIGKFNADFTELTYTVKNGDGTFTNMTATLNAARDTIFATAGETEKATTAFGRFWGELKGKARGIATYLLSMTTFQEIWQQIKQGIQYVREIDSALTELKKVTNGTNATYDAFLQTMSKTAGAVGSTVSELTTMAAEWARLGYSLEEAGKLAESTAILLNVSEFENATDASQALISTMQAFGYVAEDSLHVVDILNEVGNNFAVSSDGLAIALQDSASALMEGGNSLEQAVALIAAANKVVQDPNSVGSALRTISLRLRGTSVDVLEQMGEETDGVIESTSKLQEKIKALSGVNILTESGDYKDTYTILKEIGSVWQDMNDIDQSALLELMAGKNRANTLAAILNNMKDLEGAYNSALNSEGSALKENAAYLDSIQGRIDQFNNTLQTMWMNFINDEAVKWIVNLGTSVVQLVDKFGLLNTLTGTFTGVKTAIGSIKKELDSINKDPSKILNIFGREKDVQNLKNTADAIENVVSAKEAETMATKEKTVAAGQEAIVDTVAQGAKNADTRATIANTIATWANEKATRALAVAKALLKGLLWAVIVAVSTKAITGFISKLQENFKSAEEKARELREKVDELTDSYKNAKQEFSDNLEILITTDTEGYNDLLSEFEDLTKGVNKYGENISLTSDEYERYKEICEAIVGVNPSIVEGYNSATEAIGNNVGILQSLIDLQKEEARLNAAEYVSYGMYADNDNFKNMADNAINAYDEVKKKYYSVLADGDDDQYNYLLAHAFELNEDVRDTYGNRAQLDDNFAKAAMEFMGIDGDIDTILRDYYDDRGVFLSVGWWDDYVDEIISHRAEFAKILTQNGYEADAFLEWADTYQSVGREVEAASDYMINAFLQVPYALKEYDELSSSEQSFITEWIKNNELFKIDNSTTQDDILAAKQTIIDTIRAIANDDYTVDINGTQVTAQSILDQIFSIDASEIDYATYKADIQALIDRLWTAIGGETNTFGFADKNALAVQLGFEYVFEEETEDDNIDKYVKRVAELTGKTEEEVRQYMESQPAIKVERAVEFYLKGGYDSSEVGSLNLKDVFNMPTPMVLDNTTIVQSYSALSEKASNYNDILEQTNEISADNIEVSKEYKDSLSELGFTEEELAECFDENNGLVVKNSKELRRLVKEKKKEIAADTKLAKAQSQLEYYDLVNQLNSTLNGTTNLNSATLSTIDTLLEQIDTVKQAVYQYQLLEDSLLGATNAFETYQNAQEIDGLNTYGDDYVSMAQTMYDAFYKTGQVGTEVNWAAIEALVPDWVYAGLQSDADKMRAIYEYFNKQILPTLTLDNDQLSLGFENIEDFVNKGITAGVFEGTTEEFDLVEGMNLERAAELMGMTTTQAYALFAELDKYNTSGTENSFLSQLDDSLAGDIMEVTNNIEELNREKIALMEGGVTSDEQQRISEINEELAQCDQQLEDLGATAYTTWQEYTKNDAVLATLGEIEDKQRKLTEKDAIKLGLDWDEVAGKTVQEAYDYYLAKQVELEEPTVMTATLAVENIDDQIANLQAELNDPTTSEQRKIEIEAEVQGLEEDKALIVSTFGLELSEEDQESIQEELSSIEEFTINDKTFKVVADGASEVNSTLNSIQNYRIRDKSYNVYENVITTNGRRYATANSTAHVNGTAFKGGSYGAPKTEEALVGELGPEMVVRDGRWFTVGENGAEFTDIRKNDIIFNHKQTEDLLSKGYVTGRGKAYAEGTAYSGLWNPTKLSDTSGSEVASKVSQAAKDISDASDEFSEVFDWIEVRLEEINESINLQSARLENAVGSTNQNAIIDNLISLNQTLHSNLLAAASEYYAYAKELLEKIPEEYRIAAQNGSIAIEKFVGEVDEEILNAIQEYREWVQKGADVTQQAEEALAEISSLAKQAIDNIAADYENKISLQDIKTDQYDAYNDLLETDVGFKSANIYQAIIDENNKNIPILQKQRDEMQAELNKRVKYGQIKKYSQDWYDAVNAIAEVDTQIIELRTDVEDYQDSINELHWDKFDDLMSRLETVSDEAENLIDILNNKDLVNEDTGEWTEEGVTSLGLYAQQMEAAEVQAKKYEEEIKYLNKNWKKLGYTEQEYIEKLEDLKSGQYDAIKAYEDTKDAIVDLNKERVDAIKNGIQKEIDAYQELIDKKKEELDQERDLYDFQKNVKQQQKDIADIQRKIAALAGDNSTAARAQRVKLQAELAEAQANLEDTYYNRSVENQQEALDKELENFQNAKQDEMEGWEEYLENTNQVVADSLAAIQSNTDIVYQTLKSMGEEYGLSITESLTSPWKEGENAIQSFSEKFGIAMSATVEELQALEAQFKQTMLEIEQSGSDAVTTVNQSATTYTATTGRTTGYSGGSGGSSFSGNNSDSSSSSSSSSESSSGKSYPYGKASETSGTIKKGAKGKSVKAIQYALNKLGYGNSGTKKVDGIFGSGTQSAVKAFQKAMGISADGIVGKNTRAKFKLKGYASGITETEKDQLALIDELGEELVMRAGANGKLEYLTKGSSVIPADLTANLMSWGSIDPQDMLDRNRPSIGVAPSVINNNVEFKIDASVGTLLKIDEFNGDDPDEVLKMINKALDQHTKNLNNALKRYSR